MIQEQVPINSNLVSPYLEALLAQDGQDGNGELNAWTVYKLNVSCTLLWNVYESLQLLSRSQTNSYLQKVLKNVVVDWMKLHSINL